MASPSLCPRLRHENSHSPAGWAIRSQSLAESYRTPYHHRHGWGQLRPLPGDTQGSCLSHREGKTNMHPSFPAEKAGHGIGPAGVTPNALLRRGPAPRSGSLESSGFWAGSSGQVRGQGSWSQAPRFRGGGWGPGQWGGSPEEPPRGAGRGSLAQVNPRGWKPSRKVISTRRWLPWNYC